jgi:hypothetical protein
MMSVASPRKFCSEKPWKAKVFSESVWLLRKVTVGEGDVVVGVVGVVLVLVMDDCEAIDSVGGIMLDYLPSGRSWVL